MKSLFFIGGVSFCGLGYQVYTKGRFWSWQDQMYIDYTGIQKPMGIFMISVGIMCIGATVWMGNNSYREYICIKCEHLVSFPYDKKNIYLCPQCGSSMDELEGFYERHPKNK